MLNFGDLFFQALLVVNSVVKIMQFKPQMWLILH